MKKIFLIFALLFFIFPLPQAKAICDEQQNIFVVTANYAYVYAAATSTSEKLEKLTNKVEVEVELDDGSAKKYFDGEFVFYKVTHDAVEGYIYGDLLTPKKNFVQVAPAFNAQTNRDCNLFLKNDNEITDSHIQIKKDTRIFLYEGFNRKADFCAVQLIVDNEVIYGYIEPKNIKPDGINPLIITCFVLILALLSLIFALMFIKKKKKE